MNIASAPSIQPDQGWHAQLSLGFEYRRTRTVLAKRERFGPLAIQRPFYSEEGACHVYLLHPPGGVVGGDRLDIRVEAQTRTHCLITTPGASKFYRSAGPRAIVRQRLDIAAGAHVEWLPQENIFFSGCNVKMATDIRLTGDASVTYWDIQCFGRPANQEFLDDGRIDNALEIYRDDRPLILERLRTDSATRHHLALLASHPVSAVFIATSSDESLLAACRDVIGEHSACALTLIDDILIARYLGDSTSTARHLLQLVWSTVRSKQTGKKVVPPRIWLT